MPEAERCKTILVTSPAPGDGKTTLISNLAIAVAQGDRRTLLIDADCRRPMQHKIFKLSDKTGLSSVLGGQAKFADAVQKTAIANLDVLPCGPLPSNPAEMLDSQAFLDLLAQVSKLYDQVLIDSPPVMPVTDARILAAGCDATLLVLRAEKSTRRLSEHARNALQSVGAGLLGVVVNDVPRGKDGYGYYYYGYSYGYNQRPNSNGNGSGNGRGDVAIIVAEGRLED
jgi:capsular exopolysaccharide synthesis family protein